MGRKSHTTGRIQAHHASLVGQGSPLLKPRALVRQFQQRLALYRAVWRHPRTPPRARWLLGLALGYAAMPFDLIPDWIPVLGLLDDLVILPLLIWLAIRAVPPDVYEECRRQVDEAAETTGGNDGPPAD